MSYTFNKHPKDPKFCHIMRKAINKDRKLNGFSLEEEANELGLSKGTLDQKLKPSADNDITVSELMHFVEMSDDFSPLEYIASKYGFSLIERMKALITIDDLSHLADAAIMENNDVFRAVKVSLADGEIDEAERDRIFKEIEEAQHANAELKARLASLPINE